MMLSKQAQESLDHIRFKVVRQQYDLRGIEAQCLAQVFEEIQLRMVNKKVTLNIGCSGCIKTAVNVVYNFINQFEERQATESANIEVKRVNNGVKNIILTDKPDNGVKGISFDYHENQKLELRSPTLTELRATYPHIKATSVKVFLEKLDQLYEKAN